MVGIKASLTCRSIKQATHDVGTGRVTMTEAEEDLVAYLWDENKATVALYVFAATAIWCHHTHPTCSHVVGLPVVPPIAVQPVGEGEPYQFVPLVVRQREGAPR